MRQEDYRWRVPRRIFHALAASLGAGQRLLGLDLGEKTVGLALSDVERRIAHPVPHLPRKKFRGRLAGPEPDHHPAGRCRAGAGFAPEHGWQCRPRVQATRTLARNIRQISAIPILFWDERLSTVAAERALISTDMSRAKRAAIIDATAAAFILQGVLDGCATSTKTGRRIASPDRSLCPDRLRLSAGPATGRVTGCPATTARLG